MAATTDNERAKLPKVSLTNFEHWYTCLENLLYAQDMYAAFTYITPQAQAAPAPAAGAPAPPPVMIDRAPAAQLSAGKRRKAWGFVTESLSQEISYLSKTDATMQIGDVEELVRRIRKHYFHKTPIAREREKARLRKATLDEFKTVEKLILEMSKYRTRIVSMGGTVEDEDMISLMKAKLPSPDYDALKQQLAVPQANGNDWTWELASELALLTAEPDHMPGSRYTGAGTTHDVGLTAEEQTTDEGQRTRPLRQDNDGQSSGSEWLQPESAAH